MLAAAGQPSSQFASGCNGSNRMNRLGSTADTPAVEGVDRRQAHGEFQQRSVHLPLVSPTGRRRDDRGTTDSVRSGFRCDRQLTLTAGFQGRSGYTRYGSLGGARQDDRKPPAARVWTT